MDQTQNDVLTMEIVKSYMNKSYELMYADYRDNLDDNLSVVQQCIQEQDMQPLDEKVWEWFMDQEWDSVEYIMGELKKEILDDLDIDKDSLNEFFEEEADSIREEIHERDNSNPLRDLIRHTSEPAMFYDTGIFVDSTEFDNEKDIKSKRQMIKRVLHIPAKESRWDGNIDIMLCQASYGGRLVIYFQGDIEQWMDVGDNNRVEFSNAPIAIIDNYNGSGDHTDLDGHKFSMPLDTKNVWIDKTLKYNYTHEVCGMYDSWCSGVGVRFYKQNRGKKAQVKKSTLGAMMDVEKMYQEAFDKGGCTYGDMNMRRHRNTFYLNEFPCGTHCPTCNTFWVD